MAGNVSEVRQSTRSRYSKAFDGQLTSQKDQECAQQSIEGAEWDECKMRQR